MIKILRISNKMERLKVKCGHIDWNLINRCQQPGRGPRVLESSNTYVRAPGTGDK